MTYRERIDLAILGHSMDRDDIDKLIALAYWMGCEDATRKICDAAAEVFAEQQARAKECRYHDMAMSVQGNISRIYSPDYAGDMGRTFGDDEYATATLCAEYIAHENGYRIYVPEKPQWTWTYVDSLEEAERLAKDASRNLQVIISL